MIFVTGGAGFIGGNFILDWLTGPHALSNPEAVLNIDKLTYAGNLLTLESVKNHPRFQFVRGDIVDKELVEKLLEEYHPRSIIHFAAESHVDRSIHGPKDFIQTNILGTFHLMEATRSYWSRLSPIEQAKFRFLQISTDEVYGSLSPSEEPFTEIHAYKPNSPYAASKASSDHLVRAWHHTYGLPVMTTNCSNNYGPFHFPEKLIPLCILNALNGKPLPIYGDGQQVRDWLYVKDHCAAIRTVLEKGVPGQTYNIGGWNEKTNLEVVNIICRILDEIKPRSDRKSYVEQITFVYDRPGHDRRYAIDASKIENELGWRPAETFETGIRKTVQWYLENPQWVESVVNGSYRDWVDFHYAYKL
jgi:dTDP-glucose 4,6-dehydratase